MWVCARLAAQEDQEEMPKTGEKVAIPKHKRPVTKHWNWIGAAFSCTTVQLLSTDFVIRATRTLNMGYLV